MTMKRRAATIARVSVAAAATILVSGVRAGSESCTNAKQEWEAPVSTDESGVTIEVKGDSWGDAQQRNINVLLENVASHLTRHLRDDVSAVIEVRNWTSDPMIVIRRRGQTAHWVMLSTTGKHWAQYSYQFAHELCHLLSDYERLEGSANNWFHESICETASLFTLRSMAMTWEADPPYPNWRSYAKSLRHYAEDHVNTVKKEIPGDDEIGLWLQGHEAQGRANRYLRERNRILALRLLPVFERHPEGWNAVRRLPRSDALIGQYLAHWKEAAQPCDQAFVGQIQDALGALDMENRTPPSP